MIIKVLLLAALIKLLLVTNKPFLCSGIYAGVIFVFSIISGAGILSALLGTAIGFVLATIWFWLLNRFEDNTALF